MKAILDESAIRIAHAAAVDSNEGRPILEHVKIGCGEIVASDGFIMARRPILTEPEHEGVMLIEAKVLLMAQKLLGNELIVESQDDEFVVIKSKNGDGPMISTQLLQSSYPAYDKVIPTTERKAYVALSPDLVAKLLKVTATKDYRRTLKIKVREFTEPVEVNVGGTKVYLMPVSIGEENDA